MRLNAASWAIDAVLSRLFPAARPDAGAGRPPDYAATIARWCASRRVRRSLELLRVILLTVGVLANRPTVRALCPALIIVGIIRTRGGSAISRRLLWQACPACVCCHCRPLCCADIAPK